MWNNIHKVTISLFLIFIAVVICFFPEKISSVISKNKINELNQEN